MKKIAFLGAALFLASQAFAGPPPPPPPHGGWRPLPPRHERSSHMFGAFTLGIGLGSLLTPRSIYYSPPPAPVYSTTTIYTAPPAYTYAVPATPPVVVSPALTVPQPVYVEKEPTKLFCRSKNNFYPKVSSCAEGWLEVVNH